MKHSFLDARQFITVAVAFDRHSTPLVRLGAELCLRTGKKLNLLHVVEPWMDRAHSHPFADEGSPLWDVTLAVETRAKDLAERNLDEIITTVPPHVVIEKTILFGKPAETIGRGAEEAGSALLLIGADSKAKTFQWRGISTALSLLAGSDVPVMAVDTELYAASGGSIFPNEKLTILLADDMSPEAESAVALAFDLGTLSGRTVLHHLHVNGMTPENLRSGLETAAAASHTPIDTSKSFGDVFSALDRHLQDQLAARAAPFREYLEAAGGLYVPEVLTGNVKTELAAYVDAVRPDVLIFGRHRTLHTRPFFLGRLPFAAMMALHKPLVVVPH